jgi:NAD(P)-dependent dehydrogenase (short-subunit alcohol dehydrogenase family)
MSFDGKIVVITGAAGNLGQATARAFMEVGARCVLVDKDGAVLKAIYGEAEGFTYVPIDLIDRECSIKALRECVNPLGPIEALCNLAGGFSMGKPVHETPAVEFDAMIDVNVRSIINSAAAIVPSMLANGGGRIVNIAATAGLRGSAHMAAYSLSKSAVIRITESMSAELRDHGVNVNCVLPSIIDTPTNRAAMPQQDPAQWVTPAALADVILFLTSHSSRAIHGAAIPVVGMV